MDVGTPTVALTRLPANSRERGYTGAGLFPWIAAIAFGFVLGTAHHLDAPDARVEHDQARELEQAQRDQQAQERFARAAQLMCRQEQGPQALATFEPDGSVRCLTRRASFALAAEVRP